MRKNQANSAILRKIYMKLALWNCSKLFGTRSKKYSAGWRTIFHLSHPKASGNSVNDYISKENYSLQYVKLDDAINLIIQLGRGSYMAKTDICSAFRNIPVHPSDWELYIRHALARLIFFRQSVTIWLS